MRCVWGWGWGWGLGVGVAVGTVQHSTVRYGTGGGGIQRQGEKYVGGVEEEWDVGEEERGGGWVWVCVCSKKAKMPKCDRQQRRDGKLGEVVLERREKGRKERGDAGLCGW